MDRKTREIVRGGENLFNKMERERYENEQRTLFFFFFFGLSFFEPTVPKWKFLREKNRVVENFLTSPTFDCRRGYAPAPKPTQVGICISFCDDMTQTIFRSERRSQLTLLYLK